jgi:hypothetical protein
MMCDVRSQSIGRYCIVFSKGMITVVDRTYLMIRCAAEFVCSQCFGGFVGPDGLFALNRDVVRIVLGLCSD